MVKASAKVQFYRSLGTLEQAGMPLIRSLSQHSLGPLRKTGAELAESLQMGEATLSEVMAKAAPQQFSALEIRFIQVGEKTGRLDQVFLSLADWFEFTHRLKRQMISGLIYPAMLYHVAVITLGIVGYFAADYSLKDIAVYAAVLLGVPYGTFALLRLRNVLGTNSRRDSLWHTVTGYVSLQIPLLGSFVHKLNSARFFKAFALSLEAGLSAPQGARLAAETCANAPMRNKYLQVTTAMEQSGDSFSEAFQRYATARDKRSVTFGLIETGDMSGTLDDMSARVAEAYQADTEETLQRVAKILPVIIYLALAGAIGYFIIQFYMGYFSKIDSLL